jgi:hypothetical protein
MRDRDTVIATYERHNEEVKRRIRSERLLVYDLAQGWAPLCGFLGVSVPATPMPAVNTTEDFRSGHGGNKRNRARDPD